MRRSWSPSAGAPAVPAAFAFALGVAFGVASPVASPPLALGALAALGAAALLLASRRGGSLRDTGLFALFLAAGIPSGRYRVLLPESRTAEAAASVPDEAPVEVTGRLVVPWSAAGSLLRTRIEPERATVDGRPLDLAAPIVLAVAGARDPGDVADAGDRVRVRGALRLPEAGGGARSPFPLPQTPRLVLKSTEQIEVIDGPRGFLAPISLAHRALKRRLAENLRDASPEDRRALALVFAFLLGETADLPAEMTAAFRDGGVAHVLAISGLHVGLVAVLLGSLLRRLGLPLRSRDALVLLATALFAIFAGGRPPVLRAALMIGLYLLSRLIGRPTSPGQVVGFAALVLLALEPGNLFDIGFLLTFTAVFGLAVFGAPAARSLRALGIGPPALADGLGATLGAELAVFPVQAFVFHVVPFVALASNLVIVPLSGLFLSAALVALPFLAASPGAASIAVIPLRILADLQVLVLDLLDRLGAFRFVPAPTFALAAALAGLLLLAGTASGRLVRRSSLAAALVLALAILLWPASVAPPGTARFQALDVGQGDSWLLVTPSGRVLVDGGGSYDPAYEFGRLRLLPRLAAQGAVSFDAVVLTHAHPDHSRGLAGVLSLLPVGRLVLPRGIQRNEFLDEVLAAAARRRVPVVRYGAGETFRAAGLEFEALHPGEETYPRAKDNNGSLVLRTVIGSRALLLTGDVEAMAERDLLARSVSLRCDVLKVAHHGSRTSTTPEFLAAASPRLGLIGVGRHNRFGHPGPEVLAQLAAARVRILRTDLFGDFALAFRGGRIFPEFDPEPRRARP